MSDDHAANEVVALAAVEDIALIGRTTALVLEDQRRTTAFFKMMSDDANNGIDRGACVLPYRFGPKK